MSVQPTQKLSMTGVKQLKNSNKQTNTSKQTTQNNRYQSLNCESHLYHCYISQVQYQVGKPTRLTIRQLFGFVSNSETCSIVRLRSYGGGMRRLTVITGRDYESLSAG